MNQTQTIIQVRILIMKFTVHSPSSPVYLPDGDFAAVAGSNFNFNIAGMLAQAGRKKNVYDDIWYTGSFNLTPLKGLSIKGDYTGNRVLQR